MDDQIIDEIDAPLPVIGPKIKYPFFYYAEEVDIRRFKGVTILPGIVKGEKTYKNCYKSGNIIAWRGFEGK